MRIPSTVRPALAALAALVLLSAAWAPHDAAPQEDFRWSGTLAAGQRVEIKGVHGSIRAEPSNGSEVEVTAVRRQGNHGRVQQVRIERVMHDGGVTICAVYPSSNGTPNRCEAGHGWRTNVQNQDGRVEFVVRVPRGVHFYGTTVNGDVRALSMPADATVSTVNGQVMVSAAGMVEAATVNGSIDATTGRPNPARDMELATVNGDITLRVPDGFRARVRASLLNGSIGGDFPLEVTRNRHVGARAEGEIGRGGRALRIRTVNGDIAIRRSDR